MQHLFQKQSAMKINITYLEEPKNEMTLRGRNKYEQDKHPTNNNLIFESTS